jgi:hypothetical protein
MIGVLSSICSSIALNHWKEGGRRRGGLSQKNPGYRELTETNALFLNRGTDDFAAPLTVADGSMVVGVRSGGGAVAFGGSSGLPSSITPIVGTTLLEVVWESQTTSL